MDIIYDLSEVFQAFKHEVEQTFTYKLAKAVRRNADGLNA